MLELNRAEVSQRELAIARWGLERVEKEWDTNGWMRGQIRYRLLKAQEIERAIGGRTPGSGDSGTGEPVDG